MSLQNIPTKKNLAPQEKEVLALAEDYALRVHNQAVDDTLEFIKSKQLVFWFLMSAALVIVDGLFKHIPATLLDMLWKILVVYVGIILLDFIINFIRAPRKLDSKRQAEVDRLNANIEELTNDYKARMKRVEKLRKVSLRGYQIGFEIEQTPQSHLHIWADDVRQTLRECYGDASKDKFTVYDYKRYLLERPPQSDQELWVKKIIIKLEGLIRDEQPDETTDVMTQIMQPMPKTSA